MGHLAGHIPVGTLVDNGGDRAGGRRPLERTALKIIFTPGLNYRAPGTKEERRTVIQTDQDKLGSRNSDE